VQPVLWRASVFPLSLAFADMSPVGRVGARARSLSMARAPPARTAGQAESDPVGGGRGQEPPDTPWGGAVVAAGVGTGAAGAVVAAGVGAGALACRWW
jgi:hypothetical protein